VVGPVVVTYRCKCKGDCNAKVTCRDVQHVSGLPSVRFFLPTDLSNVELTLVVDKSTDWIGRWERQTSMLCQA
jgi:hypothetical protein